MDGKIRLWDVENREHIITLIGQTDFVSSVSFSPDSRSLASGNGDGTVGLWDVGDHTNIKMLGELIVLRKEVGSVGTGPDMRAFTGHSDAVRSVCFSPDGSLLASGSWDKTVRLWNIATGEHTETLIRHTNQINSVCFSPKGHLIASGSSDGTVRLWDTATGRVNKTLTKQTREVNSVSFSGDGRFLASGSYDNTVRLWEVATGKPIKMLTGHTSSVESVSFNPNGKIVASASKDGTVLLWEASASIYRYPTINPQEIHVSNYKFTGNSWKLASRLGFGCSHVIKSSFAR